jgi:hypothetical protein
MKSITFSLKGLGFGLPATFSRLLGNNKALMRCVPGDFCLGSLLKVQKDEGFVVAAHSANWKDMSSNLRGNRQAILSFRST